MPPRRQRPLPILTLDGDDAIRIDTAPANEIESLIATQKDAMRETFRQSGISLASYSLEVLSVARLAAAEGDYTAALKGYEMLGKHIGALSETHNHLHLHPNGENQTDLRTVPDSELRQLIEQARQSNAIIPVQATTVDAEPSNPA